MHALDPIHLANGLTGFAFAALGLWVLSLRGREPRNVAFGAFALAWAANVMVSNFLVEVGHASTWAGTTRATLQVGLGAGLVALACLHPTRATRRDARRLVAAAVLAFATGGVTTALGSVAFIFYGPADPLAWAGMWLFMTGSLTALYFLALRWPEAHAEGRRAIEVTFAALAIWYAYGAGDAAVLATDVRAALGSLIFPVLAGFVWLRNAALGDDRRPVHVAWIVLAATLVAMMERAAFPSALDLWGYGLARLVGVAILAYAIVRHQLLGVDVKVRWTISRSTIAAAFIAVFFLASEGARLLFGAGNEWVGLAAAGALVFAIAPLQRAAERLAEKAVPAVAPTPAAADDARAERLRLYRLTATKYLADGRLADEEEIALARLAQELGIGAGDAMAIRKEVERVTRERGAGT